MPASLYRQNLDRHRAAVARLLARERSLSIARVVSVVLALVLGGAGGGWLALIPIAVFIVLIVVHERAVNTRRRAEAAARFYERGLGRVNDEWMGKGIDGAQFADEHHPFASDLDLFGRGSLFELICIAATSGGRATLARWLQHPERVSAEEVRARQDAVRELRDKLDLREELAVLAGETAGEIESAHLEEWASEPPLLDSRGERVIAWLLSVALVTTFTIALIDVIDGIVQGHGASPAMVLPFIVVAIAGSLFTARLHGRVQRVIGAVERRERALSQLAVIVGRLEREQFFAPRLVALHEALTSGGEAASKSIERLRRLVSLLDARRNQFFVPFAGLMLWTTHVSFAVDRWRRESGKHIPRWIDAIGEIETLLSLASFAFEHPSFVTPEIVEGDALFDAKAAGHPLIPAVRRVTNDISLGGELRLLIVSGSNMSGKSTMLRTIGINAVLALAGTNVCAASLRVAPMAIGASIRIHDSLSEGASRFYAEIVRIREVMSMPPPMLFLLDELLHGTNSHDRRVGAEAIVRGLVARGAIGLATTHDLALAAIADELAPKAANVHFEDHLEGDAMVFDYRMRPGVVTKSNALALMRAVGILDVP